MHLLNSSFLNPIEPNINKIIDSKRTANKQKLNKVNFTSNPCKKSNYLNKAWEKGMLGITKVLDRIEVEENNSNFLKKVLAVSKNLFRGPHTGLNGLKLLKEEKKIDIVVNLKYDKPEYINELKKEAEKLGMKYYNFPVNPVNPNIKQILQILDIIHNAKKQGQNVYVHCLFGKDRTGVIIALCRIIEGKSFEEAFTEMKDCGYRKLIFPKLKGVLYNFATEPDKLHILDTAA